MRRYILLILGWISLGLGALGLVLPVLPTTPFILLAAWCFLHSSDRLHAWLIAHPTLGRTIADYLEGRGLTRRTKIVALSTLWASIVGSAVVFVSHPAGDVAMILVAALITLYILRLPVVRE